MSLLWRPHADRRGLRARRRTARPALRCRKRELSNDCPERLVAAPIRRNFLLPAPCPFHPPTGKRRQNIADHSSILRSATHADPVPPPSTTQAVTNLRKMTFCEHRRATKSP